MRLPIPVFSKDGIYTDVEIEKPRGAVIADAKKAADSSDVYSALKIFVAGCVTSLLKDDEIISDKAAINNKVAIMPYKTAEYLATRIMLLYDPDMDAVEGFYPCPRCGNKIKAEYIKDGEVEIDTRDYISNLPTLVMENPTEFITIQLTDPVIIKNKQTGEIKEKIESITMRWPTLTDCIVAGRKVNRQDIVRMQFAIYVEAMTAVNDIPVDNKWKSVVGMMIFENIKNVKEDLGKLNQIVNQYGLQQKIKKICNSCGKEWETDINTAGFFVSALLS